MASPELSELGSYKKLYRDARDEITLMSAQNCDDVARIKSLEEERDGLKEQIDFLNSRLNLDVERCPTCKKPMTAENGTCSSAHYPLQIRHAKKTIQSRDEALEEAKEALEFYANPENWLVTHGSCLARDGGDKAKKALREIEAKGDG